MHHTGVQYYSIAMHARKTEEVLYQIQQLPVVFCISENNLRITIVVSDINWGRGVKRSKSCEVGLKSVKG